MKVLMLGQTIVNGNLGCVALTYSAFLFLEEIAKTQKLDMEYYLLDEDINELKAKELSDVLGVDGDRIHIIVLGNVLKSAKDRKKLKELSEKCDIAFDVTMGDSFSDLYGMKRFLRVCLQKYIVCGRGGKMILGNQTYGPYKHWISKKMAKYVIEKSILSISRDELSIRHLRQIKCRKEIYRGTDLAFLLPYSRQEKIRGRKLKIGINVSGLLWHDVNNLLGLQVDYREYIGEIVQHFASCDDLYEVHMISHVLAPKETGDNDAVISNEIAEKYHFRNSPLFVSPIEAKSYISAMDVLIGSRMHAAIAAVSSGIATIPMSYSRKFAGVFHHIGYDYVIDGQNLDTDIAVRKTIEYVDNYQELARGAAQAEITARKYLEEEKREIVKCFNN